RMAEIASGPNCEEPQSPGVMVAMVIWWPPPASSARVPPASISTSSGCAWIARIRAMLTPFATLPMMPYQHIRFEVDERGIALLTINRPDKRNALSTDLVLELRDAFGRFESDRAIRALILTG